MAQTSRSPCTPRTLAYSVNGPFAPGTQHTAGIFGSGPTPIFFHNARWNTNQFSELVHGGAAIMHGHANKFQCHLPRHWRGFWVHSGNYSAAQNSSRTANRSSLGPGTNPGRFSSRAILRSGFWSKCTTRSSTRIVRFFLEWYRVYRVSQSDVIGLRPGRFLGFPRCAFVFMVQRIFEIVRIH